MIDARGFGRFAPPALLIVQALRAGPRSVPRLLDEVRSLDGPVGPGSLYAAIARLEAARLIDRTRTGEGRVAYRLSITEEAR